MSSPQDPNQPPQPWGAPPPPDQPGWGAPPPSNQPGWGAPPPANQPGWGAPPPAWGAPQGYQQQPGWGEPPGQRSGNRHGCLIGCLVVLVLLVLGVGGCTYVVYPYASTYIKLYQDLGTDRVSNISIDSNNGATTIIVHLAPGHETEAEATYVACHIIRPDIAGTPFANASFEIVDSSGDILADDTTPCT